MHTHRSFDVSSLVVLLLAAGATAATVALVPGTPTSATAEHPDHAHDHHQAGELPPLDGTTEATLERFLAIDPDVLAGAHDHAGGQDHAGGDAAADVADGLARSNCGVRGPG